MTSVLERIRHGRTRAFLVRLEQIEQDMDELWDWLCVPPASRPLHGMHTHAEYNRSHDKYLSPEGLAQLQRHLGPEYHYLEQLESVADNGMKSEPLR